jgi:hypothetical protein
MYSRARRRPVRAREVMFAVCAMCTIWLVAQNSMLLALLPWERVTPALGVAPVARPWMLGVLAVTLVPAAFVAGWMVSRVAARAGVEKEGRDA